jgi:hypothetical protein
MIRRRWTWAAARCRGKAHVRLEERVQDAFVCFAPVSAPEIVVAIVSDGAGSACRGGEGASLVCRTIGQLARRHFAAGPSLPDEATLRSWVGAARAQVMTAAQRRRRTPRDFAATLVLAVSDGGQTLTAHVGDGCAVARDATDGQWRCLSWPETGDYASTTYFVTDAEEEHTRIARHTRETCALALLSDGLERLALDFRTAQAHGPFFAGMLAPVEHSHARGKDRDLSARLLQFLDSDQVNSRTEDDKTLILAARR